MARSTPHNFTQGQVSPSAVRPKNSPGTVQLSGMAIKMCTNVFPANCDATWLSIHISIASKIYQLYQLCDCIVSSCSWLVGKVLQLSALITQRHPNNFEHVESQHGMTQRASLYKSAGLGRADFCFSLSYLQHQIETLAVKRPCHLLQGWSSLQGWNRTEIRCIQQLLEFTCAPRTAVWTTHHLNTNTTAKDSQKEKVILCCF